jgi:M6 family metalloprotease-like protein
MPRPFVAEPFTFVQPDGSQVRLLGWGNQFRALFETPDGYTVVRDDESGYFHYAELSPDGTRLVPSGLRVGSVESRVLFLPQHLRPARVAGLESREAPTEPADRELGGERRWQVRRRERKEAAAAGLEAAEATAVGDIVGLCLLVRFPDVPATISRQEVDDFCNRPGYTGFGNNGSVHDYFRDVSGGRLRYRNAVAAYYTARHNRAHYTDPAVPMGTRTRELIDEALDHLTATGFDFSRLSTDPGGFVYALNVFYVGPRVNSWRQGLWPHAWFLAAPRRVAPGKRLRDYQITNMGDRLTLGTFCHENGHMVCDFPDLYDYGPESYGVGDYCLMCYGGPDIDPVHVSAYLKNEAGWASSITSISPNTSYSVPAGSNDFLVHRRTGSEYFILENRQRTGRDAGLPDAGLAIWHVDESGSNSNEQMSPAAHYELSLEQADGRFDLERRVNFGDGGDLFGAPDRTTFGSATTPNSRWWNGRPSGLEIVDISAPGPVMTVKFGGPGPNPADPD